MKKNTKLSAFMVVVILLMIFTTLAGCKKPEVGTPAYDDPMVDDSTYEAADEFKYLLDLDAATERVAGYEELDGIPENLDEFGPADLIAAMSEGALVQKSIHAQANDKLVHVTGEYTIADLDIEKGDENPLEYLADAGSAEITLPNCFPADQYIGHLWIANLDNVFEDAMSGLSEEEEQGMAMFGIAHAEDLYDWIGDELVTFNIVNPDFDPEGDITAENAPAHSVLAIATDDGEAAVDLVDGLLNSMFGMMLGVGTEEGEVAGQDALIIIPPDMESNPFLEMMDEKSRAEMEKEMANLENLPSFGIVPVDGYVFISDIFSLETAINAYDAEAGGTGRMANFEIESNWDVTIDNFTPTNPGALFELIESPELLELMAKFAAKTTDLNELGVSRLSVVVRDDENFDVDLLTTRESLKLLEIIREIIAETDEETWEVLGEQFKGLAEGGGGMGSPMDVPF